MKNKITEYINRIELLLAEMKEKAKEAQEEVDLAKKYEGDVQNTHLLNHFVITNYSGLLYQDFNRTIDRLIECYTNCTEMKVALDLNEKEQEIINDYIKQAKFLFHVDKNKIVPHQSDLLELMKTKAETMRHEEFLNQYKKVIL